MGVRRGRITRLLGERDSLLLAEVEVGFRRERAVAYLPLTGPLAEGEEVLLNTSALDLGLGSGGCHFVLPGKELRGRYPGSHMKWRYTPLQVAVRAWEEERSFRRWPSRRGVPVAVIGLHSQLLPLVLGARMAGAERIVYIWTDAGALHASWSEVVWRMRREGLLRAVVTSGQALGGDFEAVDFPSALQGAVEVLESDLVVAGTGPGILGTGSRLGFSGVEQAWLLSAAWSLGQIPVLAPRISFADPRRRHRGLSHHTRTVLRLTPVPSFLPLPLVPRPLKDRLERQMQEARIPLRHQVVFYPLPRFRHLLASLPPSLCSRLISMGRPFHRDPYFFLAAAGAGFWAAKNAEATMG